MTRWGFAFMLLVWGCSKRESATGTFSTGHSLGKADVRIKEASGLARSKVNPGYLWTINDSGNPSEIYLLNNKAEIVMTCRLKGIENRDWEEIFIGPGPREGVPYIYIADIGDNFEKHPYKLLYRFEEVHFQNELIDILQADTLVFSLSDRIRDAEAMVYDSLSGNFFLISKYEPVQLYQLKYPFQQDTAVAEVMMKLAFDDIVAADICPHSDEVLLKSLKRIYYWKRKEGETLPEVFMRTAETLPYQPEAQGEAIAFAGDDNGYFTLSESTKHSTARLMYYRRNGKINAAGE
jgi:hypothetical protein